MNKQNKKIFKKSTLKANLQTVKQHNNKRGCCFRQNVWCGDWIHMRRPQKRDQVESVFIRYIAQRLCGSKWILPSCH